MCFSLMLSAACLTTSCGTRNAFVDVGANDGQSLEAVARSRARPFTSFAAFELNPAFAPVLRERLARLPGGESNALVQAAAWVREGTIEVDLQLPGQGGRSARNLERTQGVVQNMTGSSLIVHGRPLNPGSKCARAAWCAGGHTRTSVRSVDLAAWLAERFCAADRVFVKIDVEGAEFDLLEHLLAARAGAVAGLLDELAIEWHAHKFPPLERPKLKARRTAIASKLKAAGVRFVDWDRLYDKGGWTRRQGG